MSSSYGQSCKDCSQGKYRCIYRPDERDCERCQRLGKDCLPSLSVRKLMSRRVPGLRTTQIEHLEEKIEDLVTLIRTQTSDKHNTHAAPNSIGIRTPTPSTHSPYSEIVRDDSPAGVDGGTSNPSVFAPAVASVSTSKPGGQVVSETNVFPVSYFDKPSILRSSIEPSSLQADECLSFFRKHMLSFFPFMYLPPDMTAKQLREWSPFLWFNIMAATAQNPGQQFAMSDTIKRFVAEKLVVDNEKNLDLLLGLLVFISWFHFHRKDRSYVSLMASLAMSLVYDMGLNKVPAEPAATPCVKDKPAPPQRARTMAERRAVLACFFITSQVAYTQKKIDALEWTSHMDECIQVLTQSPEWPGDEELTAQVNIQLVVEQLSRGLWKPQDCLAPASCLGALQVQLEKIKTQMSHSVNQNNIIASQLLYTELIIQDATLSKAPNSAYNLNFQRYELLNKHLETVIHWFDLFFAIPLDLYASITFAWWCHMAHGLTLLHRLYTLDEPAWHRAAVHARLDLFALCDRLAAILENTATRRMGQQRAEENIFVKFAKMIRSMRTGWLAEVQAADWRNCNNQVQQPQGQWPGQGIRGDAELAESMQMSFPMAGDDAWLQDFLNM